MDKKEFNIKLGAFIKKKRLEKKWSQEKLADEINNNFQNISRLERGLTSPTLFWLNNLSNAFNMTLDDFVSEFSKTLK